MSAPTCDYCQTEMQPTEAVAALYRVLGRTDGPKPDAAAFPWCCTTCKTVATEAVVEAAR